MADETLTWDLRLDADTSGGTKMDAALIRLDGTLTRIDRGLGRIDQGSRHAADGHRRHGEEVGRLQRGIDNLISAGFDPLLKKMESIAEFEIVREGVEKLLEVPEKLAEGIKDIGEEMILTASRAERFDHAMTNALGAEGGERSLGYIEKIGRHTEFTQQQLREMNLELAKSGYAGGGLAKATEAMIDLASMSANPEQGAMEAMEALRRARTTGRLESRALVPFGISEKTLLGELSKETGLGVATVKKRLEEGKVDIETTLNSLYTTITHKTGKPLGGAGADMEGLFSTRLKNVKELPELFEEKFAKTTAFEKLSNELEHIFNELDPSRDPGKRIWRDLERILDHLPVMIDGVTVAVKGLGGALGMSAGVGVGLGTAAGAYALLDKEQKAEADDTVTKAIYGKSKRQIANEGFFGKLGTGLAGGLETIGGMVTGHHFGKSTADGMVEGIKENTPRVGEATSSMGDRAEGALRSRLDMHSPSRVFEKLGALSAAGFADGVEDSAARVEAAISRMVSVPAQASLVRPRGVGGSPSVSMPVSVTIHAQTGATAEEIGDVFRDKIAEVVPGTLQSALEQLAMQTGSST